MWKRLAGIAKRLSRHHFDRIEAEELLNVGAATINPHATTAEQVGSPTIAQMNAVISTAAAGSAADAHAYADGAIGAHAALTNVHGATAAAAANAIVQRDAGGSFAAGTITATFVGSGAGLTDLNAAALATGIVTPTRLGNGTPSMGTFLRGNGQWTNVLNGDFRASGLINLGQGSSSTANESRVTVARGTYTHESGTNTALEIAPTYVANAGNATFIDLRVNRSEGAMQPGTVQRFAQFDVNGVTRASIDTSGDITTVGKFTGDGAGLTNISPAQVAGLLATIADLEERLARLNPYTHEQATPANVWDIAHNLGRTPAAVSVFGSENETVEGADINHISPDRLTATFSVAFTGRAILN